MTKPMRHISEILAIFLAAFLVIIGALSAQTQNVVYYTDSSPSVGTRNAFPFGNGDIRYQTIVPNATFNNRITIIRDILLAGTGGALEAVYDDIEIKMGVTRQVTPTNNWTTNNPKPTTVYRGPLRIRFTVAQWGGIGLPNPYLFAPLSPADNLCVEVIVWKASLHGKRSFYFPLASPGAARAYMAGWVTSQGQTPATSAASGCKMGFVLLNGNVAFAGTGCNSSINTPLRIGTDTWPQPGKPLSVTLYGAKASRPANLVIGLSQAKWLATTLPLDMGIFGAPGCFIWNDPLLRIPLVTDKNGAIKFTVSVPPLANSGTAYVHWWVLDTAANAFGVTSSDYATIILGN